MYNSTAEPYTSAAPRVHPRRGAGSGQVPVRPGGQQHGGVGDARQPRRPARHLRRHQRRVHQGRPRHLSQRPL